MLNTITRTVTSKISGFMSMFQSPQLALAPAALSGDRLFDNQSTMGHQDSLTGSPSLADCLWLAVPKRKVSRGKKRMKTTIQKSIKTKNHIIVDSRTGEMTLRHRLPFNWKDYLQE